MKTILSLDSNRTMVGLILMIAVSVFVSGCGGGGGGGGSSLINTGGSGSTGNGITLLSITFPEFTDMSGTLKQPPIINAPLSQQIIFTFSGPVQGPVTSSGIRITADPGLEYTGPSVCLNTLKNEIFARGDYEVLGNIVVFTPYFPTKAINLSSPNALAEEVPGLLPGYTYNIEVPVGITGGIKNLVGTLQIQDFTTVPESFVIGYFNNVKKIPPSVIEVSPQDGSTNFPLNTFSEIAGFPTNQNITITFDQPLDYRPKNMDGSDHDADGYLDGNFYIGHIDPNHFILSDRSQTHLGFLGYLNVLNDDFHLLGYTNFEGVNVGLKNILFPKSETNGNEFQMVGSTGEKLYDIDYINPQGQPPICELTNVRNLSQKIKGPVVNRNGDVYGLNEAGDKLLQIDLNTGDVTVLGTLTSGLGSVEDLCFGYDSYLYGLRVNNPGNPNADCTIETIDLDTFETTVVLSGLPGDFRCFDFSAYNEMVLFDASQLRHASLDLESGIIKEYGMTLNGPQFKSGTQMDLVTKKYEMDVKAILEANYSDGSVVTMKPLGVLPFGGKIEVFIRNPLKNITGSSISDPDGIGIGGVNSLGARAIARYTTFDPGNITIQDTFIEDFLTEEFEEPHHEFANAKALWNVKDTDLQVPNYKHLLAGFGLTGNGELGNFVPIGITPAIVLDTNYQTFPLFDGSTPDILTPTEVVGGEFHFHDIIIPDGVTVLGRGNNPLVFSATGRVEIAGIIDVTGYPGIVDTTFNSAYLPTPGGKGGPNGGKGGMAQPPIPSDFTALSKLQSVPRGERGWGPGNVYQTGGEGGESGAKGSTVPWTGSGKDPESRGAGGGGGSYLLMGHDGYPGKGQYGVDLEGNFVRRDDYDYWDGSYMYDPSWDPETPPPANLKANVFLASEGHAHPLFGKAGDPAFTDGDDDNNYIGANGELAVLQGGSGGGGGGSRLDSMNPQTHAPAKNSNPELAPSAFDAKGGGGGGGGGAVAINSLGEIVVTKTGAILAYGGRGGGGEVIGHSQFGGSGGGGSGGAIILNSASRVVLEYIDTENKAVLDVSGGWGADAKTTPSVTYSEVKEPCRLNNKGKLYNSGGWCTWSRGDGGYGGYGLIQLMVPDPSDPDQLIYNEESVEASLIDIKLLPNWEKKNVNIAQKKVWSYYWYTPVEISNNYWIPVYPKSSDCLVPPEKTLSTINPLSYAISKWINLGQSVNRLDFSGLVGSQKLEQFLGVSNSQGWGVVDTINGLIPNWQDQDIFVDAPDLVLKNYIPEDNEVAIQFQGADPVAPGSKFPNEDPSMTSDWTWDLNSLSGRQFIRFRIRLDVSKGNSNVTTDNTKPQVNMIQMRMKY